ncbi:PRELI-like family-domain-containing protein [Clohesyomyces aquaticus]|uniref:PRELI-like family-domain-containing protein n=1 Tax=Clohesyomyces aquaticus TaxID=1231657 RepID=A0A1Y1YZT1_9PLEO|nr:PRELI-like family-domain-containing protein [Clohesyomyces aquaticus]
MVKFYSQTDTYNYPFAAVTLAYFLRYPNPHATHVLSTDTISRHYDPATQRLTTIRLHLKRSKLPTAVLKLLPRSLLGASGAGDTQSYILEKSVVDVREGWMDTESKNLEFTGVLSVVERQEFRRPTSEAERELQMWQGMEGAARRHGFIKFEGTGSGGIEDSGESTEVRSTVTLHSHLGEKWKKRKTSHADDANPAETEEQHEKEEKMGFFKSWSTASIQRSIEAIGLKRARRSQPNAKEGMKVVLERLREGGLVAVLEGMRRDRETTMGSSHGFKSRHGHGSRGDGEE